MSAIMKDDHGGNFDLRDCRIELCVSREVRHSPEEFGPLVNIEFYRPTEPSPAIVESLTGNESIALLNAVESCIRLSRAPKP